MSSRASAAATSSTLRVSRVSEVALTSISTTAFLRRLRWRSRLSFILASSASHRASVSVRRSRAAAASSFCVRSSGTRRCSSACSAAVSCASISCFFSAVRSSTVFSSVSTLSSMDATERCRCSREARAAESSSCTCAKSDPISLACSRRWLRFASFFSSSPSTLLTSWSSSWSFVFVDADSVLSTSHFFVSSLIAFIAPRRERFWSVKPPDSAPFLFTWSPSIVTQLRFESRLMPVATSRSRQISVLPNTCCTAAL
mmetsp:Transcript_474/g.1533  ORF Transcript_474/g.1533 Transcript_474/m.1533 type:complete len:257 (-) Transcript_474:1042-1812(-)